MKKVVIAQVLQKDVDTLLKQELAECDSKSTRLGDAFLIQMLDSVHAQMKDRPTFKKYAERANQAAEYYSQLYPKEFVQGMTKDHTGKTPTKKTKSKEK